MKKVININFQGSVIPIEETAYDILKQYVESLRNYFANEEGKEEIINDIEGRIAELFGETLKKGTTCIGDEDVNKIIDSMGRPADFDADADFVQPNKTQEQINYNTNFKEHRKLYRDENQKVIGGVCSGIANYLNIDPLIARILFIVFFGFAFILYLVLWIVIPSSATVVIGSQRKRFFRDTDDKIIGGVCSGISQYFGMNVWIPRLLFLLPFLSFGFNFSHWNWWNLNHIWNITFSPGSLFVYIILWLVLPEAKTAAEKLEMKGEKVDLNSIKNTIQSDMEGFGKKAKNFGEQLSSKATIISKEAGEKAKQFSEEATTKAKKSTGGLGRVLIVLIKAFVYFIIGIIVFALVVALFGIGVAFTGLLPFKNYLIDNGWQNVFGWGTLLLFIWLPIIAIVVFIIRRLTKMKGNSSVVRYSFISLWILGLASFIGLIVTLSKEFKYRNNPVEETIVLSNPSVKKLEVNALSISKYYDNKWFKLEPFAAIDEDSIFIRNVNVRITKSTNDSFHVTMVKLSNGASKLNANKLVSNINYNIKQIDSTLLLDKGIAITPVDKFRNQQIIITIAVPVGKKILIKENSGWSWKTNDRINFGLNTNHGFNFGINNDSWDEWKNEDGERAYHWNHNVEYIMTADGLKMTENNNLETLLESSDGTIDGEYNIDGMKIKIKGEFNKKEKKSKEQLQKEYDETQKKANEIKKELEKSMIDSNKKIITKPIVQKRNTNTLKLQNNFELDNPIMMRFCI